MKIFKCEKCSENCILTVKEHDMELRFCPFSSFQKYANWVDVKEEVCKVSMQDNKLPDWVKVGKWGYDMSREKYFEVVAVSKPFNVEVAYLDDTYTMVIGIPIFNGDCVQAHKRPFNEAEMKSLVGKVLETPSVALLVNAYGKVSKLISTAAGTYTAEDLRDNGFIIDGKPCYVLEHLNEKGEWVE